jgi:enoyl-CoA hydratase/carnithine racemase
VENDFLKDRNERIGGFVAPAALEEYAARYSEHLVVQRQGGIVEVRMHTGGEPAVYSRGMLNCWGQALCDIGRDPENEVLILTGTGSRWIAGVDPHSFAQPLSAWHADELYEQYLDGVRLLERLVFDIQIPTIAAINGTGPRLEIALLCDVTLCAEDVVIADGNFIAGSVPGDGMFLALRELLGTKRATHLVYTGAALDAQRALGLGVVSEVLSREHLIPRAREIAERILTRPRIARRLTHGVLQRQWQLRVVEELRSSYAQQLLASSR